MEFLQLAEDIKYASTEEALRCLRPHWLQWLRKADRQFDELPEKFQSEKIVFKIIGWCAEPLKSFVGNYRTKLKNEQSALKDSPEVYIDKVSEVAKLLRKKDTLSLFSRSLMEEVTAARKQAAADKKKIATLEAEIKALKKNKETSGGKSGGSKSVPASLSAPNKDEYVMQGTLA